MNWRATIAAGLIFIALLAFVWVESSYRVAEEGEVFRQSFLGLNLYGIDVEKVTKLQIDRAGEETAVFERRGDEWYIVEPFEGLADSDEVMRMVRAVAELRPRASRDGVDLAEEQFGLANADLVATLTYNGGSTARLKVGAEATTGTERYAQVSGSERLYIVGADARTTLWKDPLTLRAKTVAKIDADAVRSVRLDHGDEQIVAVRTGVEPDATWRLTEPLQTNADEWNVRQLLNKLSDLRARDFLPPGDVAEAELGLDEPQATVTLAMADAEPLTITFGKTETREVGEPPEEQEIVYVRSSRRSEVLLLTADVLEAVQKGVFDLRDRSIVSFNRENVTRVRVERTKGFSFTIARRPSGWFVEKPRSLEARQGAVDDILWNLEDLSAIDFVTDAATPQELRQFGLSVPQAAITVELRGSDPIRILIGDDTGDGSFYARTGESEQVVKISEFLMGDLPEGIEDLDKGSVDLSGSGFEADEGPMPDF
ncbi:MAG: DUF4340 domain-containing protein [Armatimonadota bacterium]|jgi:hypothetical protein